MRFSLGLKLLFCLLALALAAGTGLGLQHVVARSAGPGPLCALRQDRAGMPAAGKEAQGAMGEEIDSTLLVALF